MDLGPVPCLETLGATEEEVPASEEPQGTLKAWPSRRQERQQEKTAILLPARYWTMTGIVPGSSPIPQTWGTSLILQMCKLRLREMKHLTQGHSLRLQ